ncbi:MAG TPA: hypothetical protein VK609_16890, partial [Mucilaginibacter sp.]|nr:hypothetical protein [Mucilaginibacter sp.]
MKTIKLTFLFTLILPAMVFSQDIPATVKAAKPTPKVLQAELLRGPYLQVATPTSMTIRWRTNVYDRSSV